MNRNVAKNLINGMQFHFNIYFNVRIDPSSSCTTKTPKKLHTPAIVGMLYTIPRLKMTGETPEVCSDKREEREEIEEREEREERDEREEREESEEREEREE